MRLGLLLFFLLGAAGCVEGVEEKTEETGSTESAIVNGEIDDGDKATVALLTNGAAYCTGVLISPYVVATAGHCVTGVTPDQVFFGSDPKKKKSGTLIDVVETRAHRDFDQDTLANDIAVVALAERGPTKPARLLKDSDVLEKDVTLRIVGFGLTSADEVDLGPKHSGETKIASLDDTTFRFTAAPAQTCHGDSGGPAFASIDGKDTLVGITSAGDSACKSYGRDTRVDAFADFLEGYTDRYAARVATSHIPSSGCSASGAPHTHSSGGLLLFFAIAFITRTFVGRRNGQRAD